MIMHMIVLYVFFPRIANKLAVAAGKTYNNYMKLTEFVEGSGIYKISKVDLPEMQQFIRAEDVDGEVQPLLHVCERDLDPYEGNLYIIMTEAIRWDTIYGHYKCTGCKRTFYTKEELALVWADGKGTGAEYEC
jgi:hypothetical protein